MKALSATLLITLLASAAAAQSPEAAADAGAGVSVVEKSWKREVRNPAMEDDPFRANDDHRDWVLAQKETMRQNKIRARQGGQDILPPVTQTSSGIKSVGGDIVLYVYRVKLSNGGAKAIQALEWEYVFLDPGTRAEAGRHSYSHKVKLRPGKTAELFGVSTSPPTRVVDASKPDKPAPGRYAERVRVTRIEYDDGTVWKRPTN
jgi:hypothetical protein